MNFEFFFNNLPELTITGLAFGAIYALIALGYTMVYGVLQLINFAHSEVFMYGTFAMLWTVTALGGADANGMKLVLILLVSLVAAMLMSAAVALVLERVAYRPLLNRNAPRLIAMAACPRRPASASGSPDRSAPRPGSRYPRRGSTCTARRTGGRTGHRARVRRALRCTT